jgi:steroid delta-isomerase-like uncharacterized protein
MEERTPTRVATAILEAYGRREIDTALLLLTDNAVSDYVALRTYNGKEEIRAAMVEIFEAFPDFSLEIGTQVANNRLVSTQWTARGTFTGTPFQGLKATGREIEVRGCDFMEIENGLMIHNTVYFDYATYARQVGALPEETSAIHKVLINSLNTVTEIKDGFSKITQKVTSTI